MHKKRKIIINFLKILLFTLGVFGILVWVLNTVSQNKTLTGKFIHFQIERLLDLDSYVENPRAYLDWDLQYKIRADRLSFIQNGKSIVSAEDIHLNVFLPYMLLKKIYITQMSASNFFVDAERYKDGKINIVEIFNIKSFFDIYFRNSAISLDGYYVRVTDNFHQPAEKFYISGDNVFLNKFTTNRYLQLIMDGNIDYKNRLTNFAVNFNAKIPTIKKNFNFEIRVPDFDAGIFSNYVNEFAPNTTLNAKGSINAKISNGKFVNFDTTVKDVKIKSPKLPVWFDFSEKISITSRLAYENKNLIMDEFTVKGKDFETSTYGRVYDITARPLNVDLNIKVKENSNGNTIMHILPWGLPPINYAVDKAKKHNVGAIVGGYAHVKGKIGYLDIWGHADAKYANLGYGFDFPNSTASIDFKGEKMYIDGIYYPNKNPNQYTKIDGSIKIKKPIYLDLKAHSSPVLDMVSGQKALNIFSDIFNFSTGPVALMNVKQGLGTVPNLEITATPPKVYLNGSASFWNGEGSLPGLYGEVSNVSGEVEFLGKDIVYKNIKGIQEGTWGYAHGKTDIHNDALTHFYMHIPAVSLVLAKHYIDNSPLIKQISDALKGILEPKGIAEIFFVLIADKNTQLPYTEGFVSVPENGSCRIAGLAYRAENVSGRVDFDTYQSRINFDGYFHGVKTKLTGIAEAKYSDLLITNPAADIQAAYEFFQNSPMFADMKDSLKDFSGFEGKMDIKTRVTGDLAKTKGNFTCDINILDGKIRYLDMPDKVVLNSGNISATREKVILKNVGGTIFETPFALSGLVSDAGTNNEKYDVRLVMKDFPITNVKKLIGTKLFTPEVSELLKEFEYKNGFVDVVSFIDGKENKAKVNFNNVFVCYKKSNNPITVQSGEIFFSNDVLRFSDLDVQMTGSKFLIDGIANNYQINPDVNIDVAATISEDDFNRTLVPMFNMPVSLTGKIYTNVNLKGSLDNWRTKMRAMLDDGAYVSYKNANIGSGLSRFMFLDVNGNQKDINLNTLDIFSPTASAEAASPDILAQLYGRIKDIDTASPRLEDFHVKFNDYMDISFLNILFYNPNNPQPFLTDGKIKGDIKIEGGLDNLSILGKAKVVDAVIPSIASKIEEMTVDFNKYLISIKDAVVDIAGSKTKIFARMANDFTVPVSIEELSLKSDLINMDDILKTFNGLFAQETPQKSKKRSKEKEVVKEKNIPKNPPVVVEKGKIDVKEIIHNGLSVKDVAADFKIYPNWNCEVKNISAQVTEGMIAGDINYNFHTTDINGNIQVDDVMANAIAATFLNLPNELYGLMDANAKFSTKGKTREELMSNLNGNAYFKLDNGRMLRLGSIEYMLRVANTFKGGLARLNLNAIVNLVAPRTGYFDTIEGDFKVQNGIIYSDRVTSKSPELNLFMTGMYNMNNSYVNGTIIGQMPMESKESILWLGSLGRISLNSLIKQMTKEAEREQEEQFLQNPMAYINGIPGLKGNNGDYRFFAVSLKGNLYTDKYVDNFKWIK